MFHVCILTLSAPLKRSPTDRVCLGLGAREPLKHAGALRVNLGSALMWGRRAGQEGSL